MSDTMKKAIILSLIGGLCGAAICFAMSSLSGSSGDSTDTGTIVFYYVISFLHGAICMGTAVIYDIERWSVARTTITHFLITLTSFYILGTLQHWLVFFSTTFWIITVCFVVAYFIVWAIINFRYRKAVREMNDELKKLKKPDTI
ncbi:MAG: DUF3021 domain-containing protein [Lachnospiraceae bacterium]|nr:DUF3021 domain-containing protein [Lachnospiraceae bacterium]